ncbi:MAG TPA: hypothetical protein VF627_01520 [Abditibacterium sp.]|jgi:hypothetical protein
MKERISQWPYLWGFFLGGAALPLLFFLSLPVFTALFPTNSWRTEISDGNFLAVFAVLSILVVQGFRGALLGFASELFFHAHLANSLWARPLAIVSGLIGTLYFAPSMWANWPTIYQNRADSPEFNRAIGSVLFDIIPLVWSASLVFLGICVRRK